MKRPQQILFACILFVSGAGFGSVLGSRGPLLGTQVRILVLTLVMGVVAARPLIGGRRTGPAEPKDWHPNLRQ